MGNLVGGIFQSTKTAPNRHIPRSHKGATTGHQFRQPRNWGRAKRNVLALLYGYSKQRVPWQFEKARSGGWGVVFPKLGNFKMCGWENSGS